MISSRMTKNIVGGRIFVYVDEIWLIFLNLDANNFIGPILWKMANSSTLMDFSAINNFLNVFIS